MRGFFHDFLGNIKKIFWGCNLLWHFLAIALTYILVVSGFDWYFFQATRSPFLQSVLWPAVPLGGLIPLFGILIFFAISAVKKNKKLVTTAFALGQAALFGLLTSDFYKFFTGRPGPPDIFGNATISDTSHIFHFGILQGGIFFGWPSSHTTVAFAMAVTLFILYRNNKFVRYASIIYALYIGISVSVTIHWFSDFAAGIIFGTVIGTVVGKSFRGKYPFSS
jgi:membrane-associated phospholipid phosphatase